MAYPFSHRRPIAHKNGNVTRQILQAPALFNMLYFGTAIEARSDVKAAQAGSGLDGESPTTKLYLPPTDPLVSLGYIWPTKSEDTYTVYTTPSVFQWWTSALSNESRIGTLERPLISKPLDAVVKATKSLRRPTHLYLSERSFDIS